MSTDPSSSKDKRSSLPPYKDPISAGILSFLALIFIFIGIIAIAIPLITSIEVKNQLKNSVFFTMGNQITDASLIPFILFAIGCFIFSAILFVLSNIACDAHLTEYNIRQLLNTQQNQEEQLKQFHNIDKNINNQERVELLKTKSENNSINPPQI